MELTVSYFFFAWKIIFDRDMVPQSLVYEQRIKYNNPPFLKKNSIISKRCKKGQGFFVPVPHQWHWDDDCAKTGVLASCFFNSLEVSMSDFWCF